MNAYLCVTPGSHFYIEYHRERKQFLRKAFLVKGVEKPSLPVSVGQGYVQLGKSEWHEGHCVRYHTYLNLENHDLPDPVAFAYRDSNHSGFKADALSVKKYAVVEKRT